MNIKNSILARNILIHKELEKVSKECTKNNIKLVLLKGMALIEVFPEYSFEREMEDVDVLVDKNDFLKFLEMLKNLGYEKYSDDPNIMFNQRINLKIDISTKLWYLSEKENKKIMNSLVKINYFYILPFEEMLKHIILHSYIEHNYLDTKWLKDIELLMNKINLSSKIESFVPKIFLKFLNKKIYYKGHLLQFLFLPFSKKLNFLFKKMFPCGSFMLRRYNIKNVLFLPFFYLYRCVSFIVFIVVSFSKLIYHHEQEIY